MYGDVLVSTCDVAPRPIRVFLVDDHRMFVESLTRLIEDEPDMEVVGHAGSGEEALASLDHDGHDVVVMDYQLPGRSGAVTVAAIREQLGDVKVVMLSGQDDPHAARAAAEVGCRAFVTKSVGARVLVDAVRSASVPSASVPFIDASLAASPPLPPSGAPGRRGPLLSTRELEVLRLLDEGLGTDAIAATLFISRNTVRAHVQRVISKLGAHSKLEAVAMGRRAGLL